MSLVRNRGHVPSASDISVGDTLTSNLVTNLTRTQIVQYAGASGDYNPIHSDDRFATEVAGYPSVFAHGMLTMGLAATLITDTVGDGQLTNFGVRFVNQVWPGDNLDGTLEVVAIGETDGQPTIDLKITAVNQDDKVVLTGTATAKINP